MLKKIIFALLCFTSVAFAATNSEFVAGKDYQIITPTTSIPSAYQVPNNGKIQVIQFFSYGCPACNHLEPLLEQWLKNKPANVDFIRVPVAFEQGWDVYAKAYFIANAFGVADKLSPLIFNAIHKQGLNLSNESAMQQFFVQHGVSANDFAAAYDYSTAIALNMNQANTMMQAYQVMFIPTFVVAGKYETSAGLTNGDDTKLMQILSYLIQLAGNNNTKAAA